jgi:GLPGLI family protein
MELNDLSVQLQFNISISIKNMKSFIVITFFACICPIALPGQVQLIAEYQGSHKTLSRNHKGLNTLYTEGNESMFINNDYPATSQIIEDQSGIDNIIGDAEKMPIYMNMKTKQVCYKSDGGYKFIKAGLLIFQDSLPVIHWKIYDDSTKTIGAHECTYAEGLFGQRLYSVWFSYDVPTMAGPYKLNGLPGLIFEARSRDGIVLWSLLNYKLVDKQSEYYKAIVRPQKGTPITHEVHRKMVLAYKEKVESTVYPGGGIVTIRNMSPESTIERGEFSNYIKE